MLIFHFTNKQKVIFVTIEAQQLLAVKADI